MNYMDLIDFGPKKMFKLNNIFIWINIDLLIILIYFKFKLILDRKKMIKLSNTFIWIYIDLSRFILIYFGFILILDRKIY